MISSLDQSSAVVVGTCIGVESSALDVNENGMRLGVIDRSVDIQEETVFGLTRSDTSRRGGEADIAVLRSSIRDVESEKMSIPYLLEQSYHQKQGLEEP